MIRKLLAHPAGQPLPAALSKPGCPKPASSGSRCSPAALPYCLVTLHTSTRLIPVSYRPGQPLSSRPLLPARCIHETSCPGPRQAVYHRDTCWAGPPRTAAVSAALPALASPRLHAGSQLSGELRLCARKMVNKMVWIYFSITTSRHCQPPPLKSLSQAKLQT